MHENATKVGFGAHLIGEIFPFHLGFDEQLRVVQHGVGVTKVCPDVRDGVRFGELFTVYRPRTEASFADFRRAAASTFFIDSIATKVRMRGQMGFDTESGLLFFIGTPWFVDIDELRRSQLGLKDFTVHDPIVDFLYMVQAKTLALADATKFSETIAKQRDELMRTNEELARASAAKSQFLANTSHELRTPLNGIMGMGALLQLEDLPRHHRNYADKIMGSAKALLVVVNDVLDFSKMEAGKLTLEPAEFRLHELAHEVTEVFAASADQKGLDLVCIVGEGVPVRVVADDGRFRQILSNLLGNAIKFTSKGEVVLRIDLVLERTDDYVLRTSVRDTGIGVDEQGKTTLFTPFSQVDGSMARRFGGTGLGLAISKQLAELMGGEIGVESESGVGSTFWFTATLKKSAVFAAPIVHDLSRLYALIADPCATSCDQLRSLLERHGATVDVCEDGAEALRRIDSALAAGRPYDLAVLDVRASSPPGAHVAKAISANPRCHPMRTIVLYTTAQPDAAKMRARVDAFVSKPVNGRKFIQSVARLFGHPVADSIVPPPTVAPRSRSSGKLRLTRVLVVEDHPVNQEVAVSMLATLGYAADVAANGHKAIEAIEQGSYFLVLMDLQMPELDGYAAAAEIRRRERGAKHIPIIALSAHAMEGDRAKALAAGMDDYLTKPVDIAHLAYAIGRWAPAPTEPRPPSSAPRRRTHRSHDRSIDTSVLDKLRKYQRKGAKNIVTDVIEKYLADLPERLLAMRHAAATEDRAGMAAPAHALKSSSASIGAIELGKISAQLEAACLVGDGDTEVTPPTDLVLTLFECLEKESTRVRADLQTILHDQQLHQENTE